jgi:hypothetical protein
MVLPLQLHRRVRTLARRSVVLTADSSMPSPAVALDCVPAPLVPQEPMHRAVPKRERIRRLPLGSRLKARLG